MPRPQFSAPGLAVLALTAALIVGCSDDGGAAFPPLSRVPGNPPDSTEPQARRQIVAGLVADRENAKYIDEELRATPPDLPPPSRLQAQRPPSPAPTPAPAQPRLGPPAQQVVSASPQPAPAPLAPAGDDLVNQVFRRALQQQGYAAPPIYAAPTAYSAPLAAPTQAQPPGPLPQTAAPMAQPATYAPPLRQPTVIRFSGATARLTDFDRRQIGEAAERWKTRPGPVRVVGYAGGEPGSADADRTIANFRIAGARADAVATELRRGGVDTSSIVTEARPSAGPSFYVGTREGQAESRRVEIFID